MRLLPLLATLLIAAGLYYWFGVRGPEQFAMAAAEDRAAARAAAKDVADAPVSVMVLPSAAEETSAELILRGRTEARRIVEVAAETTGRMISDPLRQGTHVEAGQVLCRLDPGVRDAELAEAEAALAGAEAEAAAATALEKKGYTAETALKQRQAELRAAQAQLDQVRLDIKRLSIEAPFSGFLETDTAELGSLLVPGSVCAAVVDLSLVKVEGYVSEQEVGRLNLGQRAEVRLIDGRTATGEITFIGRMADHKTHTFPVEATLPNPDGAIRDGMTAELRIALPAETAHFLPQSALTLDDDGRIGVRVAEDGVARFYPVEILRDGPDGVWVSGLPGKADVIVVGQGFVRAGAQVAATPVSRDRLE